MRHGSSQARQRHHRVEPAHRVRHFAAERGAKLLRLDVLRRRHERARQDAVAGQRGKVLRPSLEVALVNGVGLGLVDGAVAVGPQRAAAIRGSAARWRRAAAAHRSRARSPRTCSAIGRRILGVEMLDHADAQTLQPAGQPFQAVARSRALRSSDRPDRGRQWHGSRSRCPRRCASSARRGRANGSAETRPDSDTAP